MANIAATAESKAGQGMRFFFAPQLLGKGSLQPVKNVLMGFVQMIAEFLATAELIPATHRSLRPLSSKDARLGEVLALAYANLRRPGTRLDQYVVFGGVVALFALMLMMAAYAIFSMLMGTAHAAITITFSFAACTFAASSYFTTSCAGDMAQQWIDALLLGANPWWLGQTTFISPAMQNGLGAMFQTYSLAILVLAGFLVLYHLIVVIAGTAHEGRLGGKVMNQIWAPIRLVAAIGMLVPLGGASGLNSGQMIAVQVTKWGSGLASNTWMAFANTFTNSPYVILPPIPQTVPAMTNALKILVCQKAYSSAAAEIILAGNDGFTTGVEGWYNTSDGMKIAKSWFYRNNVGTNDREYNLCGNIEMLRADYAPSGTASQFLSSSAGLDASADIRTAVLNVHRTAIDDAMAAGSRLDVLAQKIYDSSDSANTNVTLGIADILEFNIAVGEYRTDLAAGVRAAVIGSTLLNGMNMTADAMSRGWVSAAVWFNSIAKINGMLIDYTKAIPNVNFNFKRLLDGQYLVRAETALASTSDVLGQLDSMAAVAGTPLNEPLSYLQDTENSSPMDNYLFSLAQRIKGILGSTTNSIDEMSTTGLPGYASGLALNTANPLAELSALGHRMVEAAFVSNDATSLKSCIDRRMSGISVSGHDVADERAAVVEMCEGLKKMDPAAGFIVQSVSGALVMAGITLAFVLPLLPFIRFLFGILTWIIAVFETVIAIPVVALAHIKLDGDGLAGPMARSAYMLLLQVFLRPVLMVFGLMVALLVFNLMIVALNEFYSQAVRSAEGGGSVSALASVVYTVIYVALAYGLANASFKAIDMVPNQCLMWIGGATQQGVDGTQYVSGAVGQAGQQVSTGLSGTSERYAGLPAMGARKG